MAYLDFSLIFQARLLVPFTLSVLFVYLILNSSYFFLILTPWVSDYQHTHMVPLCLLVSGTKYSLTLLLSFTFFNILFDLDESHYQVYNFLKILPCVSLFTKSPIMKFLGHHSTFNSSLLIHSVMKEKKNLMCLVHFLVDDFPFFYWAT